jgi:membrane-associated phospholipid phosphatase
MAVRCGCDVGNGAYCLIVMKAIFYDWGGANIWLFHAINDIRSVWLDSLMLLGTFLGDHNLFPVYLALLTLLVLVRVNLSGQDAAHYRVQVNRWMSVVTVFSLAYLLDGVLLAVLKPLLDFPRPPLALPQGSLHIIGTPEYHHSLPSGHSSFAMLITASLWPVMNRGWRTAGVLFVLWVGISRISLGAHFPADVAAGFISSLLVVLLVYAAIRWLLRWIANAVTE